jgi:hypothetical protein
LKRVLDLAPTHPVVHGLMAEALESTGDLRAAAEQLEAAANVSEVEAHQIDLRYRAALLWLDRVGDRERGVKMLETVADVDILYLDSFPRLRTAFTEMGERAKLATLGGWFSVALLNRMTLRSADCPTRLAFTQNT